MPTQRVRSHINKEVIVTKLLFAFVIVLYTITGSVMAKATCPPAMAQVNACAAYQAAADAPLTTSAQRQDSDPEVSCLEIRARTPSVLLVYEGPYVRDVDTSGVRVITRFRQMSDWRQLPDGKWAKMICIPKSWMQSISTFTICGDVGHYYFDRAETAQFLRQRGRLTGDDIARMWQGG